ncbi:hypothetical protein QFZ31_001081 [Neobacillus niacini]|nr:hypothetical protein [Neobacillus niacini]
MKFFLNNFNYGIQGGNTFSPKLKFIFSKNVYFYIYVMSKYYFISVSLHFLLSKIV